MSPVPQQHCQTGGLTGRDTYLLAPAILLRITAGSRLSHRGRDTCICQRPTPVTVLTLARVSLAVSCGSSSKETSRKTSTARVTQGAPERVTSNPGRRYWTVARGREKREKRQYCKNKDCFVKKHSYFVECIQ